MAAGPDEAQASVSVAPGENGGSLSLPSASFIASGHFVRVGNDLRVTDSAGNEVVVQGYFAGNSSPDLIAPDGGQYLTPALVESFLTPMAPGQYAQAVPGAVAAPIGQVLDLDGDAVAVRADGTRVQLATGDPVYEGDVIETGGGSSAIRMAFTDNTEFSLGTDGRLALDQLVFNPDTQSGSAQFSVLKGVFIFASGQIAKTDNTDMTVTTPVATIGIRGTEVAGRVADGDSQFTVIDGAIEVTTRAGSVTLDDRGETTRVAGNDAVPSDPVVLTAAQFGQAYGEVAGVVSNYFGQTQPGAPGSNPGGDTVPPDSGGGQSDPAQSESGDRADVGTMAGSMMLASALPSDTSTITGQSDPFSLTAVFTTETTTNTALAPPSLFSVPPAGLGSAGAGLLGAVSPDGGTTFVADAGGPAGVSGFTTSEEDVITVVPGSDFAGNLTFAETGGPAGGATGFNLVPSGNDSGGGNAAAGTGSLQVAFSPVPGVPSGAAPVIPGIGEDTSSGSAPLDMPSTGSSGSPFRSEAGSSDPFSGNPYVSQPFGYSGPRLGDAVFDLVADNSTAPDVGASVAGDDPNTAGVVSAPPPPPASKVEDVPDVPSIDPVAAVDIALIVSNATRGGQFQNLNHNYELDNLGTDSFALVGGREMALPGVADNAQIAVARDGNGNVDTVLNTAWNSVKNIRAESDMAAEIRIENFVHTDVQFGDGGDSHIAIVDAKRGFITTGNRDDTIEIDSVSNGPGWSNRFDIRTGAGDDVVIFEGASNGLSELFFDGGAGVDTLYLTGPGKSFDLSAGQLQIAGVERIDISSVDNATLTVSADLLLGQGAGVNPLTGTAQTLVIDGAAGDTVVLQGDDWTEVDTAEIEGYAVYEHASGVRVAADGDLQVA